MKAFYNLFISFVVFAATLSAGSPTTPTQITPHGEYGHRDAIKSGCSTNAECLRNGQNLIKPQSRKSTNEALAPRQSSGTPRVFDAIQLTGIDGTNWGYVRAFQYNDDEAYSILQYTSDASQAMSVSYVPNNNNDAVTFTISSSDRPSGYPYIAGLAWDVWGSSSYDLGPGNINYAALTAGSTQHAAGPRYTGPADTYVNIGTPSPGTETALWKVNPTTLQVTPQWTNNDNSKPATSVVIWSYDSTMYLTGDPTIFINSYNSYQVTLKLVNFPAPPS